MAVQSRTFSAGGMNLHALEAGEGDPVLFLHGWPTNAQLWRHALAALAPHRRGIALDLPGFGKSDKPAGADYDFAFYDRIFDQALEVLGVDRLGLCVHDAGGPIGLYWAIQRPERITELCLLNTLASADVSWAVKGFLYACKAPVIGKLATGPWAARRALYAGMVNKDRITPDLLQLYSEPFEDEDCRAAYRKSATSVDISGLESIAVGLGRFQDIPVRIIYGKRDGILPEVARTMRGVKATLPHADVTELPLGHFLQEDDPDGVAELIRAFFAR